MLDDLHERMLDDLREYNSYRYCRDLSEDSDW